MDDETDNTTQLIQLLLPEAPVVLIVDDDEQVLEHLKQRVIAAGYTARTAVNGAQALRVLDEFPVSIVVADLTMPVMSGLELCRAIRGIQRPAYVYILLLTMRDNEKDLLAGLEAGADDYLSKRVSSAQFTARLRVANRILALEYSLQDALAKKNQLAMTDELTGLYNRRYFIRHLNRALTSAKGFGGDLALLLLDVDHFKNVNDTYGHAVGDMVLSGLARQIETCLRRETDWCARMGGEEFAVVLEGTNLAEARICAERIRQAVADHVIQSSGELIRVTVSVGVSGLEELPYRNAATTVSLLELADANLYVSKAGGRNRISLSDSRTLVIPPMPQSSRSTACPG